MEQKLIRKLYRFDCPSSLVLGEYQLGLLEGPAVALVKSHLHRCELCRAEVDSLTTFLSRGTLPFGRASAEEQSPAVSYHDYQPVLAVRRVWERIQDQDGVRRIMATLLPAQPRMAVRDPSQQHVEWPRRYTGEDVNISLQLEQSPERDDTWQLVGLVNRQGMALSALMGTPVQLVTASQVTDIQQIDDLGNFIFATLTPATYTLEVHLPDKVVFIEQLVIAVRQ
jgi:hypothetical protein